MSARIKLAVICYLVCWTTTVAWLATLMIGSIYPELHTSMVRVERDVTDIIPQITPFLAFPLAFYHAEKILRRKIFFTTGMILRYFLGAPVFIFMILLVVVSLLTLFFAPLTFVLGFYYGLLPLLLGTVIHCLGAIPIYFLPRSTFRRVLGELS